MKSKHNHKWIFIDKYTSNDTTPLRFYIFYCECGELIEKQAKFEK